jgi:hypothetical protein
VSVFYIDLTPVTLDTLVLSKIRTLNAKDICQTARIRSCLRWFVINLQRKGIDESDS